MIRNDQDEALTDESLPSEGVCSLLLAAPKGESFRVPIARWWTEGVPGPPVGLGVNILE